MSIMPKVFRSIPSRIAIIVIGLGIAGYLRGETQSNLRLEIQLAKVSFTGAGPVVRETLVNTGDRDLRILKWHLPCSGHLTVPIFVVRDERGLLVPYMGILAKRAAPDEADFVSLRVRERLVFEVNLASFYKVGSGDSFSVSVDKDYVDARPSIGDGSVGTGRAEIVSNELTVTR